MAGHAAIAGAVSSAASAAIVVSLSMVRLLTFGERPFCSLTR
jgi:hypothetical protein